jgi:hypothetical protein
MPLRILHIQYWGFEPKDCIPTFPYISPWGVLAYEPCLSHAQNTKIDLLKTNHVAAFTYHDGGCIKLSPHCRLQILSVKSRMS